MRTGMSGVLLLGSAVLLLSGCQTAPAPPPAAAAEVPPPKPLPPTRSVNATWSFGASGACTASVGSPVLSLDVSVGASKASFSVWVSPGNPFPRGAVVPIAYSGASAAWTITGRAAGSRRIIASEPMAEEQASRILFLLDGGTIRLGDAAERVPVLRVPNAGQDGRAWFECVRKILLP